MAYRDLTTRLNMNEIIESRNLVPQLDEHDRNILGGYLIELFEMDRNTRMEWEERMVKANKVAMQFAEKKTFPWVGAANIKFPLIAIAALQFHSRLYPALIDGPDLVKCAVTETPVPKGGDPNLMQLVSQRNLQVMQAAERISAHMSWQLLEEDESWEGEEDKALLVLSIMGSVFKKSHFDIGVGHNVSECVLPQDLVISYSSKSIEKAARVTHILMWNKNDLVERVRRRVIVDTELTPPKIVPTSFGLFGQMQDRQQGMSQPSNDPEQPYIILEMHLWLDLDGDGMQEPYVALVRYDTKQLLRLVARFLPSGLKYEEVDGEQLLTKIEPERFYTQKVFIPSPDGGIYGLGFGALLGDINESISSSINQLLDAGTMSNAGGGFLGRGARIKGGENSFLPGEWKGVDSTGDDLRKSVFPLPVREPSSVLLQLLSILVDFGQRLAGAPDVIQGQNPGQNTPAETSRSMLEQGIKVFSGIYKRAYRAFKEELRKLYRLNQLHLDESQEFASMVSGFSMKVLAQDYKMPSSLIRPVADPYYMSESMKMNQAQALMQASMSNPGFDRYEVMQRYLKAWKIQGIDEVLPDPKGPKAVPPPPNPKLQIEQLKIQADSQKQMLQMKMKLFELMEEHDVNRARILEMEANAEKTIKEADGISRGHSIAEFEAAIGAAKLQQQGRIDSIKLLRDLLKDMGEAQNAQGSSTGVEGKSVQSSSGGADVSSGGQLS